MEVIEKIVGNADLRSLQDINKREGIDHCPLQSV